MTGQDPPVGSGDLHIAVGQQLDLPPRLVKQVVMSGAAEKRVPQAGLTSLGPVNDVVRLAPFRRAITPGEAAVLVTKHQCRPQSGGDGPCRPAEVEDGRAT